MSSYVGKYAEYYDLIYAEKPYAAEAAFIHDCIRRHSVGDTRRLLELACGTGRHALELEKLGYQIVASDYSQDLLAVARSRGLAAGSRVQFELQDMRQLSLGGETFDAVYCLFDSIGYVQTNAAVLSVLSNVREHLRSNGLFLFEFWHAAAMLRGYEPHRQRSWQLPNGLLERSSDTRLDVAKQLAEVSYQLKETRSDGSIVEIEETQLNRFFLVQEMSLFLEQAGFEPLEWIPAYEGGEITPDTWHILAVARRR